MAEALANMPVAFPILHVEKNVGKLISQNEPGDIKQAHKLFDINCKIAKRIGAEKLVLHLWSGVPSDRCIQTNIDQFGILNEMAAQHGLLLTVENVPCNHENPMLHLVQLKEAYPDIAFTFDVKFAKFHDELDLAFSEEYRWLWDGAVQHLHISDYAGGYMDWKNLQSLHVGEGKISFDTLSQNLKNVGYKNTITVESSSVREDGTLMVEKLNRSLEWCRRYSRSPL